jgi:hypothetical protein
MQTSKIEVEKAVTKSLQKKDDVFKMNSAKDEVIFKEDHPYFDVPKKYKKLAQNNFNLPIPKKDGI